MMKMILFLSKMRMKERMRNMRSTRNMIICMIIRIRIIQLMTNSTREIFFDDMNDERAFETLSEGIAS
jgi:hypothetical protein